VPEFIATLRERKAIAALALEFAILTAARSGEVLGARWAEIDLDAKVWTVPAARMKAGREHRVPLSGRALAILETLAAARTGDFVFPGQKAGKSLSGKALEMVLHRMKVESASARPSGIGAARQRLSRGKLRKRRLPMSRAMRRSGPTGAGMPWKSGGCLWRNGRSIALEFLLIRFCTSAAAGGVRWPLTNKRTRVARPTGRKPDCIVRLPRVPLMRAGSCV
jgi:hypothetical protein